MKVRRIIESCLYVDDIDEAERFYTELLGIKPFAKVEGRHVFYKLENGMFLVFNSRETEKDESVPPHGYYGKGHIAFAIEDEEYELWKDRLENLGIEIEKEIEWPSGGKSIYFRDPFGNSIEFTTPKTWGFHWKEYTDY